VIERSEGENQPLVGSACSGPGRRRAVLQPRPQGQLCGARASMTRSPPAPWVSEAGKEREGGSLGRSSILSNQRSKARGEGQFFSLTTFHFFDAASNRSAYDPPAALARRSAPRPHPGSLWHAALAPPAACRFPSVFPRALEHRFQPVARRPTGLSDFVRYGLENDNEYSAGNDGQHDGLEGW